MSLKETLKGQYLKNNIFAKYFILFAAIFLVVLTILGTSLIILVNVYTQNENTKLLKENTRSISESVNSTLIVQDMNNNYTVEKEMICSSLYIISNSIDADLFVCDVEGNIIMCKEKAGAVPFMGELPACAYHNEFTVGDVLLKSVYEGGYVGKGKIPGCQIIISPLLNIAPLALLESVDKTLTLTPIPSFLISCSFYLRAPAIVY